MKKSPLRVFVIMMCFCLFGQRWQVGSQIYPLIGAKLHWESKKEAEAKIAVLTSLSILGAVVGAAFGTKFMERGRRKALIVATIMTITGNLIAQIVNWPCILVGSFIFATGLGALGPPTQRYIEEFMPDKLLGPMMALSTMLG